MTLNLKATDDVAVARLEYSLDGGVTYQQVPIGAAAASVSGSAQLTKQGNTAVLFRAIDTAGKSSEISNGARTTLVGTHRPSSGDGLRVASTAGLKAGDRLTLDSGVSAETVTVASIVTPDPPSPAGRARPSRPARPEACATRAARATGPG